MRQLSISKEEEKKTHINTNASASSSPIDCANVNVYLQGTTKRQK